MRKLVVTAVALTFSAVCAGPAAAHTETYPTEIQPSGSGFYEPFAAEAYGRLISPRAACVSSRTVNFYFISGDTPTLVDVDTSSRGGAYAVFGEGPEPDSLVVHSPRKRLANSAAHTHTCGGDADQFFAP